MRSQKSLQVFEKNLKWQMQQKQRNREKHSHWDSSHAFWQSDTNHKIKYTQTDQ